MKKTFLLTGSFLLTFQLHGQIQFYTQSADPDHQFPIAKAVSVASVLYDTSDAVLAQKSAAFLAGDIEKVTGQKPELVASIGEPGSHVIIVGTVGQSRHIGQLVSAGKLDVEPIRGQWERFIIQTIDQPFEGVEQALVIAGSDRRGTAFGVFTLSKEMGISPWYWWADAPVRKSDELYIADTKYISDTPSVKYRGIFINDEAPALRGWAREKFGGFNHEFYAKVFELILRNRGNYLWPAMWQPSSFFEDDPENLRLADEYGIVISTTHHEPMMRAHEDWGRNGGGDWNYETNKEQLQAFWREGIERMGDVEGVVTVGMRGDGDEAMTEETAVDLMKEIISDQREIIADVTGKPAEETPQVWAVYKEVQDYYDKGLRVDDDITVLFCDDNWGNVRILPKKEDLGRSGGFGMYYHFDFVGGPVSYRWLNVTQIERVWEQMNLSYAWGVRDLWIVNVGDLKPMELPISFFLDFAWDTDAIRAGDLPDYYTNWAGQQFGPDYADDIGEILALYTKYNARRTPEMLKPDTYSLDNYREADRVLEQYRKLRERSRELYERLPESHRSAFYQLVLSPVELCCNLNEMYVAAGKNRKYLRQNRASANDWADRTKEAFFRDAELTREFHEDLEDGKWNHIMAQTHIGYSSWNNPPVNRMPDVAYIHSPEAAGLGLEVEHPVVPDWRTFRGNWRNFRVSLPTYDPVNDQTYYLEIFNRGSEPLDYTLTAGEDWIHLSSQKGTVKYEEKILVSIDWEGVPGGQSTGEITIEGAGDRQVVKVPVNNAAVETSGFVENNGVVSMEAAHYTNKTDGEDASWVPVPNMGRTLDAVTVEPADADRQTPGKGAPMLEYTFTLFGGGDLNIDTYLSPTLNYKKNEGLKYAIAVDDEAPQIINIHEGETTPDWEYPEWWNNSVTDHIRKKRSVHTGVDAGVHTLKIWMVDPGVVFQKFVIDAGGLKPSYLGPPESVFISNE